MPMPVADAGGGGAESGWVYPAPGWVCSECGFDYDACSPAATPKTLRGFGRRYRIPLVRGLPGEDLDGLLRKRPDPQTWSALEYACHTRDGFALYEHRIGVVLVEDRPMLPRMRRDEVALERDYNSQKPAEVSEELAVAAEALAARLESVPPQAWVRVGVRDNLEMTIDWMARNVVHEGTHHLLDIGRSLRAARQPRDS
jgi:Mycothiol maleylpyruvate isomerase N-terminal domain